MRAALAEPRRRSRRVARDRARRGAGQWRPRPARRLLHGKHGDAVDRRPWLRHPLRPRPVPPGHQRRLAARISRGLAGFRQPVGIPAPRSQLHHRLRRRVDGDAAPITASPAQVWHPGETVEAVAYDTPVVGWRGEPRQHAAPVVGARARPAAPRRVQPRRSCRRAGRAGPRRSDLQGALSRATRRRPARNCGCGRSISSPPPRCRIWSAAISSSTATSRRWPTRSPSSSTTPIRPSPSPS